MRTRLALATLLVAPLLGCPQTGGPKNAQLHVTCQATGKVVDGNSEPPDNNPACPSGTQVSLSYDNDGNYGYVIVWANTRDNIVFWVPDSDTGQSVAIQPGAKNAALPGSFTLPVKTRDVMAMFSKTPMTAKDMAQRTRDVTLGQLTTGPNPAAEVRVRISREYGPVD